MFIKKHLSVIIFCAVIPAAVIAGYFLTKGKQYFLLSLMIVCASLFPFFLSLERKKLKVRELVITASAVAAAVASRAAFFFLPNIKPMCAILIIFATVFGAEFGFVSGAISVLLSNFIYGQGMWTPFQMLGMGLTVFACAWLIRTFKIKNRLLLGAVSGALCFVIYGVVVDISSVFMMVSQFNISAILSVYLAGVPFNAVHGVSTAIMVAAAQPLISKKLERVKTKYGIFSEKVKR